MSCSSVVQLVTEGPQRCGSCHEDLFAGNEKASCKLEVCGTQPLHGYNNDPQLYHCDQAVLRELQCCY